MSQLRTDAQPHPGLHADDVKPLDPGRVNTMDPLELRYWSRELRCSEARLIEAVADVGDHVAAVRDRLAAQ
jgi:hypothetical protein